MLGVQHQRNVHCFFPALRRFFAVQQVQEMAADRVVIGFWLNTLAVVTVVIPVEQDGTERGQQLIGNITRAGNGVPLFFRQRTAQRRYAGAHHVHRMRCCWQRFQYGTDVSR